jgi:hypothetical protein
MAVRLIAVKLQIARVERLERATDWLTDPHSAHPLDVALTKRPQSPTPQPAPGKFEVAAETSARLNRRDVGVKRFDRRSARSSPLVRGRGIRGISHAQNVVVDVNAWKTPEPFLIAARREPSGGVRVWLPSVPPALRIRRPSMLAMLVTLDVS